MPDLVGQFASAHTGADAGDMQTKAEVDYRPADNPPDETCGACVHYHSDNTCELVSGKISPKYVCDEFTAPVTPAADKKAPDAEPN